MDGNLWFWIGGVLLVALSFFLGWYIQKLRNNSLLSAYEEREKSQAEIQAATLERLRIAGEEIAAHQHEKERLNRELARQEADLRNLQTRLAEQKEETEKLQEKFTLEFENLANKILEEKSLKFTKQNKENLENILNPLKEKISNFEEKVEKTHKESIDYHAALRQQIFGLKELNEQMSREATNLTRALKGDSKMQGNWGELVLERVLEKSGLEKDREYVVQQSFTASGGKRQMPDVIINLPDGKKMVVDAKVSLTDYERLVNAEEEERKHYLKQHLNSLKKHVDQLSAKKYEDLYEIESPDFVLMFIPIEPAFAIALNEDNTLYNKAFEQNIVIVTPSTLLATLRTIDSMWSNEKQQRNAMEIAKKAGALYDKFVGFITDLTRLGNKMDDAKGAYEDAMKKIVDGTGNLVKRVEDLKIMGAKAKKSMPEKVVERANESALEEGT